MAQPGRQTAEERLERLGHIQALLARVSREIGPATELQPVLQAVLSAMRSLVDFRGGTIQLVDDRGCYIAAADPTVSPELMATRVPVGTGLSGRAVADKTTLYSPDLDVDPRVDPIQRRTGDNAATHSYLVVPLIVLGECIGAIQVDSNRIDAFAAEDTAVLEGLAVQVAGAIESARRFEHVLELQRLKDNFVGRISHELRTPLTIIAGFTETLILHGDALAQEERDQALARIKASADRLRNLLEEVLYFSSLDAGSTFIRAEQVSLTEVACAVKGLSQDPSRVHVDVPADATAMVDPVPLRYILHQLVDNALKYAGDAVISSDEDLVANQVIVSVRDHGPGIPADRRGLIFERFWRGEDPVGAGMGLGLATVLKLCASIGASVDVSDPPGGGTQVNVRIART
jgi:signal transduction histidine kinase